MSTTAFIPLIGPAYLAHTLRSDHKPENTIDLLKKDLDDEYAKEDIPTFKHGLLDYDWAPEILVRDKDLKMFKTGTNKFKRIAELIWTADEVEEQRQAEAKAEAKAKRRQARKAAALEAGDRARRRDQKKSDDRTERKARREKKDAERRFKREKRNVEEV